MLQVEVAGSGRSLVLEESQQGQEGEERLRVTQQDGGGLRRRIGGPEGHDRH